MEPGERLRALREQRGMSAADLAKRVGRSESAVRNQENGTNGIPTALAARYAAALGSTAAYILYGDGSHQIQSKIELQLLPIRGRVQAGAWLQVDDFVQDEPKMYPAARDPRFLHAEQWLSEVVGDSVNKLDIKEGDLVHVVELTSSGWNPTTGDIVEIERSRFQGAEREVTIKQVEIVGEGSHKAILFWPRSTNPRFQDPITIRANAGENEDIEVRIRGWVINLIRPLHRLR